MNPATKLFIHLTLLKQIYETSGHLEFYSENMFSQMEIDTNKYQTKPMNCPFHIMIYKNGLRSYKELPIKYAEIGTVYRYERSGVLHDFLGLEDSLKMMLIFFALKIKSNEKLMM